MNARMRSSRYGMRRDTVSLMVREQILFGCGVIHGDGLHPSVTRSASSSSACGKTDSDDVERFARPLWGSREG